jgi:hypothetical protein
MSDINEPIEEAKSTLDYCKSVVSLLKERKFFAAIRETFGLFKAGYVNHLKGKYVEVKGHKIPMTGILVVALLILYCLFSGPAGDPTSGKAWIADNIYDRDGLRISGIKKCDSSACGTIENNSERKFNHIRVHLVFRNQAGQDIAEGTANALKVAPGSSATFEIPCEEDFAYAILDDVLINPKLEPGEKERLQAISTQNEQQPAE